MARANLKRLEQGKLYYSISEVCGMTGLEQHVLRYWESEFPQLRPRKNRAGNRAYRSKEIKIIRYIKYLLYDELYTIPGAKKKMAEANLADLEGQMSLIRVPATRPLPRPSPRTGDGHLRAEVGALRIGDGPGRTEDGPEPESTEDELLGNGNGNGSHPDLPEAAPGPEAAAEEARLRGELERLRSELREVLAVLTLAGRRSS